ncbi:MAG: hypothetical protein LBC70_04340 [Chitinispirillales bacterium]|jgi:uncharacterized membrane protein|nr:hypothetical protein [Chitinispirillales bacterium]
MSEQQSAAKVGVASSPAMGIGDFLNFGLENAKKHWLSFFGLVVISVIAFAVAGAMMFVLPPLGILILILLPIPIAYTMIKNILNLCRGQKVDLMLFLKIKPTTMINLIIAGMICSIAITIGFILLIIPGLVMTYLLMFTPYLIIDRDMGAVDAIKESINLTKSRFGDIFVGLFVSGIVTNFASMFIITLIFTIPMACFVWVYPYLALTGQLEAAKKCLGDTPAPAVSAPVAESPAVVEENSGSEQA